MSGKRLKDLKGLYDLIIVGGGIYGATLLWEATLKGLSAILIERGDFGCATSSNSLKIIHGGIRYLQNLDFKRMRESNRERRTLMMIAPHLVHPLPCITPTYRDLKESRMIFSLAFFMNDLISFDRNKNSSPDKLIPSCSLVSAQECKKLIPDLDCKGITGGAIWHDALVFNSERLVLSFILSACEKGADAFNYVEMTDLIKQNNKVIGIEARDFLNGQEVEIMGRMTVNSSGPWINRFYDIFPPGRNERRFAFTKAVNIIVPRQISTHAIAVRTVHGFLEEKRRLLFFVPWRGTTMIGTWYFSDQGNPDSITLTEDQLHMCIGEAQNAYPGAGIRMDEVSFVHVGMVPSKANGDREKSPNISRRHRIIDHSRKGGPSGIISVMGVKYTTARDVAEKTIGLISAKLGIHLNSISSEIEPLHDGDMANYRVFLEDAIRNRPCDISAKSIGHLVTNYGTKYKEIEKLVSGDKRLGELVPGSNEVFKAEVAYSVRNEFTYSLSDLISRRTDLGTHRRPPDETIFYCADIMEKELGWTQKKRQSQIDSLLNIYAWRN